MLDRRTTDAPSTLAPEGYTPTTDTLPRRVADFATLGEALDYAATGQRGFNFHDARGTLLRAYPYSELKQDSLVNAYRFANAGLIQGAVTIAGSGINTGNLPGTVQVAAGGALTNAGSLGDNTTVAGQLATLSV